MSYRRRPKSKVHGGSTHERFQDDEDIFAKVEFVEFVSNMCTSWLRVGLGVVFMVYGRVRVGLV